MNSHSENVLIRVENISKHFGGVKALQDVSFTLHKGEIMALAGHNGAGKSVLCKIMGGIFKPDQGRILFEEKEVRLESPKDAQGIGYYVVPQELSISKQLSVADNIFIGRDEFASGLGGGINKKFICEESKKLLKDYFDIDVNPSVPAGELDTVTQRLIQVVRCLSAGAKIIVFDETTAGLAHHERYILFKHINLLAAKGIGIIFISHIISEMMEICDNVTILRGGKLIGVEKVENLTPASLIEMIAGKHVNVNAWEKITPSKEKVYSVNNLSTKNRKLSDISFDVKKGEIIGIYGLRDQGQTLLLDTLFGAYKKETGEFELEGKKLNINSPVDALKNGIVYLPNRGMKTVFRNKSIIENLIVETSNFSNKSWFVKEKNEKQFTDDVVKTYGVRGYSSIDNKLSSLSGGNMQKVLIARAMMMDPKVIMFNEPTEGIDIGAKEEVKQLILKASKQGKGIILVTTEIEDIIEMCHRVIIIRDKKLRSIIDANQENKNLIIEESIG